MALRGQERGQRMTVGLTMEGFHSDISSDCHIRIKTELNGHVPKFQSPLQSVGPALYLTAPSRQSAALGPVFPTCC